MKTTIVLSAIFLLMSGHVQATSLAPYQDRCSHKSNVQEDISDLRRLIGEVKKDLGKANYRQCKQAAAAEMKCLNSKSISSYPINPNGPSKPGSYCSKKTSRFVNRLKPRIKVDCVDFIGFKVSLESAKKYRRGLKDVRQCK